MKVIDQLSEKNIEELHQLYQQEWWTQGRTIEETKQCVDGSQVCIAIVDDQAVLQGFARVVTDFIFKAFIFDVIVAKKSRGRGIGDKLLNLIKDHGLLQQVKCFELYCLPELEEFYKSYDFTTDVGDIQLMRCDNTKA